MAPDGVIVTIDPDVDRDGSGPRVLARRGGVPDERIVVVNEPALDALAGDRPATARARSTSPSSTR